MISGLLVLLLVVLPLPESVRAGTGLKPDRGDSDASTFADTRPVGGGGGEVSGYLGILCLEISGEVLGLGLEISNRPGWVLALWGSTEFVMWYGWFWELLGCGFFSWAGLGLILGLAKSGGETVFVLWGDGCCCECFLVSSDKGGLMQGRIDV